MVDRGVLGKPLAATVVTLITPVVASGRASATGDGPAYAIMITTVFLVVSLPMTGAGLLAAYAAFASTGKALRPIWRMDFYVLLLGSALLISTGNTLCFALYFNIDGFGLLPFVGALFLQWLVASVICWRYLLLDRDAAVAVSLVAMATGLVGFILAIPVVLFGTCALLLYLLWAILLALLNKVGTVLHSHKPPFRKRAQGALERYFEDPSADPGPSPADYSESRRLVLEVLALCATCVPSALLCFAANIG